MTRSTYRDALEIRTMSSELGQLGRLGREREPAEAHGLHTKKPKAFLRGLFEISEASADEASQQGLTLLGTPNRPLQFAFRAPRRSCSRHSRMDTDLRHQPFTLTATGRVSSQLMKSWKFTFVVKS